ncbi:MAG: rod shape-determining protein MreC [Candidatus Choladocola sp.]|nr:rod shape-determining protein MreC [Candidatus Choladocola sp.]
MKRKNRFTIPSKYILFALTLLCVGTMSVSFLTDFDGGILNTVSGYVLIPVQKGINAAGGRVRSRVDNLADLQQINEENQSLKEQVAELTLENNMLMQERYELQELRDLYNLDSDYSDLNKIAANVIGKDTGNWFNMFIIDKGSSDGIKVDMNVIAGGGLVGIVTKTGPDWAQVRSIIDDMSNVSAMILKNSDLCYVRGDLEMMSEGTLQLNQLRDQNDEVESGDKVVTSYASAKYHKGILIGYVNELAVDSNNLTKSGSITPAVDFEHLSTVLVITDLKQQVDELQADATEEDTLLDETTEAEEDTSTDAAEDPGTSATSTEPTTDGTPADQITTE